MATHRQRSTGSWEFIVRRKGVLPKPLSLTFKTEAEGIDYCRKLEALLDKGIIPQEFADRGIAVITISDAIRDYERAVNVPNSDSRLLAKINKTEGSTRLSAIDYPWVEDWIAGMKRVGHLAPSTIRHGVGALSRCFDWCSRRNIAGMVINPIKKLPRGYATYSAEDIRIAGVERVDNERDRRVDAEEEKAIRKLFSSRKEGDAEELLFDLALESAMRMREMYTLEVIQVDLSKKTAFLDKTKNGDKRQVPLTTVAIKKIKAYTKKNKPTGLLFPWWDGKPESLKKTTDMLSARFARIFEKAKCEDLDFHDLRHEATCRFYLRTKLSDVQIARITGHKDPKQLRRYASLRGSDLAAELW